MLFQEEHSRECHRMSAFDCINGSLLEGRVGGPSKIAQFENTETVKNILRFDISMDDIKAVKIPHSARNLSEVERSQVLFTVVSVPNFLE